MKSKKFLRLTALFICVLMLLPTVFACGEKPDDTASTTSGATESAGTTATADPTTEKPTDPPTTEEPTEPTEPFVPDLSLPYWEQIAAELAHNGLTDGVKIFAGEDEAELMKKFGTSNTKRTELDLSGDDSVPFSAAYTVNTSKDQVNFWEANYSISLWKDVPVEEGDLIVGVLWIRGRRTAESDMFMEDEAAQFYLAIKTETDNWATEGDMTPTGLQFAEEEWQKVFFCGYVLNEEPVTSKLNFNIYMGYGIQEFDIGGIIAYKFPGTLDNEKAVWNFIQ